MRRPRLHPVRGKAGSCGPTALAALTGLSTDTIARLVIKQRRAREARRLDAGRQVRRSRRRSLDRVSWMYTGEALTAIAALGGSTTMIADYHTTPTFDRPTLADWFDGRQQRDGLLLIVVTGHFVAAAGSIVVCSMQGREERHYNAARCAGYRVEHVFAVNLPPRRRTAAPRPPATAPAPVHAVLAAAGLTPAEPAA